MNICNILQRFLVSIPGLPVAGAALGAMAGSRGQNLMVVFESLRDENRPHPENRTEGKEAGLLGPTKADWGQTWPSLALSWAEQELTCAQLGPNLCRTGNGATWARLCASWA